MTKHPATAPSHLSARSLAFWQRANAEYDLGDVAAAELLLRVCEAMDVGDAARVEVERDGMTYRTRYGEIRPNPAVAIGRDARIAIARLLRELRITEPPEDDRAPRLG